MNCDPARATPATVYMDGVEYFPTNKFVLFGFQFKSIAGLAPVVGAITAALLWGWLPALIWILIGNIFIGWVQDYFSCMISIRKEGKSFGPLAYELISPRTRNILMIFLVFYLILIMAAFSSLAAGMLKASINSILPTVAVLLAGVLVGLLIYKLKMNPFVGTIAGIVLIVMGDMLRIPVLPPYYSLRLLPHVVPHVKTWKRTLLRERDVTDTMFGG